VPQITTARLHAIDRKWRSVVNKHRGPIPTGLVVAHIVAESNGDATPVVKDAQRSIGMMRIPYRVGLKHGYTEEDLEDPIKNIYVWCMQTNKDSERLRNEYTSSWTEANYDYWLSLRLIYTLGFKNYNNLAAKVVNTATTNQLTAAIQDWIRISMPKLQRFGTFRARDLRRIADELDLFKNAMILLGGPNKVSKRFFQAPEQAPGGEFEVMRALGT
jgi:hypothetical protein